MDGQQIETRVASYPAARPVFRGVYSSDMLPRFPDPPYCFIANTEDHTKAGAHWVSFYVFANHVEFFDSYGRSPDNCMFPETFSSYISNRLCFHNSRILEGFLASTCGEFSIYYVTLRSAGVSYREIIDSLSINYAINDYIVKNV